MRTARLRLHLGPLSWRVALLALAASVPLSAFSQAASVVEIAATEPTRAIEAARGLAAALLQDANLPGLSVAVGLDGKLVWSEGFGYADLEQRVPVTSLSRFRIGSVSKTLTATAIGLLMERGALDLDAPVQRYVPSFPEKPWPITSRQLGGHLAGIRSYKGDEFYSTRLDKTVTESLQIFANDALIFRPGTDYQYTTYGWSLLSAVVEGAAREPFLTFMEREVFGALDLRHTVAEHMHVIIPDRVRYYERSEDRLRNAPFVDNSNKWAGGGFLSTPSDLIRFGFDHLQPGLLKRETLELLMKPQRLESGKETDYGIGWQTRLDIHNRRIVGHGGGSVGGSTAFVTWPQERMVVVATTNLTEDPGIFLLAYALGDIFRPPSASMAGAGQRPVEGAFTFDLPAEGALESAAGTILLQRTSFGYRGWIAADDVLPFGRIVWGRDESEGTHLMATTPQGLLHLWLATRGPDISGRWMGPGGSRRIHGRELDRKGLHKREPMRNRSAFRAANRRSGHSART